MQAGGERHEFGDGLDLLVVGGNRRALDPCSELHDRRDVEIERAGVGQLDAVVDQIPVRPEVLGHAAGALVDPEPVELAQLDECPASGDQTRGRLGVVEEVVEEVVPLLFEREAALEFVEHREAGWQARFDGEVEQDATGERVQRSDRRMVETRERCVGVGAGVGFEALTSAAAEFGGRLLGEGDRGDSGDRNA